MKIVYVYADNPQEWNSSEWRCAVPTRAINRNGLHQAELLSITDFAFSTEEARIKCTDADVIVIQRMLVNEVLTAIQHWKARDKVVIAEFDDAFDLIEESNVAAYEYWKKAIRRKEVDGETVLEKIDPDPLTQFKWGLRLVHAGTTPSKRLCEDWKAFTDMHYLPNYIELENYASFDQKPISDEIIIGWGGSASHYQSFSISVGQALKRICKLRPMVKVMICGSDTRLIQKLGIPKEQIIHQPWVKYSEWPEVLSNFDIGIAPLQGDYDDRRSWIKILEYMVMRIPWVASEGPSYYDYRDYGWLVKNNSRAWERVLLDMVDHIQTHKNEAAREPYIFGISKNIDDNLDHVINTYAKIKEQAYDA